MTLRAASHGAPRAHDRVAEHLRALLRRLDEAQARWRDPDDADAVHDLRVAARRAAAALSLWRAALRQRSRRRLQAELRALRRRAGALRELEVSVALLAARRVEAEPERLALLESLLARLDRRRGALRRRAARRKGSGAAARRWHWLERALGDAAQSPDLRVSARHRLDRAKAAAATALRYALAHGGDGAWHAARIAVKRWRYALESWRAVFPPPTAAGPSPMRPLQAALGDVQDRAVLRDLLLRLTGRWLDRGHARRGAALAALIGQLESERRDHLARALPQAEALLARQ